MKPISIIVMDNIMGPKPEDVNRIYDLKGSTFERITKYPKNSLSVLKDLNLLDNFFDRVVTDEETKKAMLRRIERDKEFLKSCKLMDYSLLIYFLKKNDEEDYSKNTKMSIIFKKGENG